MPGWSLMTTAFDWFVELTVWIFANPFGAHIVLRGPYPGLGKCPNLILLNTSPSKCPSLSVLLSASWERWVSNWSSRGVLQWQHEALSNMAAKTNRKENQRIWKHHRWLVSGFLHVTDNQSVAIHHQLWQNQNSTVVSFQKSLGICWNEIVIWNPRFDDVAEKLFFQLINNVEATSQLWSFENEIMSWNWLNSKNTCWVWDSFETWSTQNIQIAAMFEWANICLDLMMPKEIACKKSVFFGICFKKWCWQLLIEGLLTSSKHRCMKHNQCPTFCKMVRFGASRCHSCGQTKLPTFPTKTTLWKFVWPRFERSLCSHPPWLQTIWNCLCIEAPWFDRIWTITLRANVKCQTKTISFCMMAIWAKDIFWNW